MDTPARANFGDSRGAFCSYQAARVKTGVRRAFCCRRSSRRRRENTAAAHSSGGTNQPRSGIGMSAGAQKASLRVLEGAAQGRDVPLVKTVTTFGKPGDAVVAAITKKTITG